jgi:predicted RNase H-like HicB family nuclease
MKYTIIIEKAEDNYSAYVPDLPGCVSTGSTISEIEQNMKEAISGHLEVMQEYGDPIPKPSHLHELSTPASIILELTIPELEIA